jgi:GDPmannose 4,6-dehydratase
MNLLKKKALIIGISGQDGAYLSRLLLEKKYEVYGTSRDIGDKNFEGIRSIGVEDEVKKIKMMPSNFKDVYSTISKVLPDEIYNLSGQSSVSLSFQKPLEAFLSISVTTSNILEAIRIIDRDIKFYNAGSGEVFGNTYGHPANEETPFNPISPYGLAKAQSTMQVKLYRETFRIYACTGILFNHESPLRPEHYVTQKIIKAACRIGQGSNEKLLLGNINISRDWGYAPEYVEAMWRILQQKKPQDIIIATGRSVSLEYLINTAFNFFNLNWKDHVLTEDSLIRKAEILTGLADPSKAKEVLGWKASYSIENVVENMIQESLKSNEGKSNVKK